MNTDIKKKLLKYNPIDEWNETNAKAKLGELYIEVLNLADSNIQWYQTYRKVKGFWSKLIRIFAIILLVGSTLIPYFSFIFDREKKLIYIGYILAGIGAGFLLIDRYYGFSNSWVRFVLTAMDLENMRNLFVENWQVLYLSNLPLTIDGFRRMLNSMIKFHEVFNSTIRTETEAWAKDFQQNMKDLISEMNNQTTTFKTTFQEDRDAAERNRKNSNIESDKNVPVEVIREAIDKNYDNWRTSFNIVAVSTGKKITNGVQTDINCLIFSPPVKLKEGDDVFIPIPKYIRFFSLNGRFYDIPTDVRASGGKIYASVSPNSAIVTPALLCDDIIPKRPGCSISRIGNNNTGTLGLKVFKNGEPYLLSCYHILCAPELSDGQFIFSAVSSIGDTTIISPGQTDSGRSLKVGKVTQGVLNGEMDCAIAIISDPVYVIEDLCGINKIPSSPINVGPDHAAKHYPVQSVGRTSGVIKGAIQDANTTCDINYWICGRWEERKISGLISSDQATQGGDSGAPVVDEEGKVIGIIIASSRNYSYIIPIQRILARFLITLK